MNLTPIFYGEVQNGKLRVYNREKMNEWIKPLKGMVSIRVQKPKKQRSSQENRYYWGVPIKLLSEHTGFFPEEMHMAMRQKFLKEERVVTLEDETEVTIEVARSTTSLSTSEMEDYLARIRQFAATELNLQIPEPNEVAW